MQQTESLTRDQMRPHGDENVGNIMLLEHVNLQITDQATATLFYLVGLGLTRDPHMMVGLENMWVNIGEQQCHLPTGPAQRLRGHIGLVTPSLAALAGRLDSVAPRLAGTEFTWSRQDGYIAATCPWGNQFRIYEPSAEFGNIQTGIAYVQFNVPLGTAGGIAQFYRQALQAPAGVGSFDGGRATIVDVGIYQRLVFREQADVPAYDGHHIAIYIADFASTFDFLSQRGLITEDPVGHQLRFQDIVHPETGEKLFTIEHEVRSMRHAQYRRPLVNRTVGQFQEPTRPMSTSIFGAR